MEKSKKAERQGIQHRVTKGLDDDAAEFAKVDETVVMLSCKEGEAT